MTAAELDALQGELERRFVTITLQVPLGDGVASLLAPRSAEELLSEEDFERDERLPYWADLWPSARVLSRVVLAEGARGRTLELGCGLGLLTAAALRAGDDVLATDYYEDALLFTRVNGWRAAGRAPDTRMVDWRRFPADLGRFDRVLAADVLYERPNAALLAHAMAATIAPGGEALVADPGRVAAEDFLTECESRGVGVVAAERWPFEEGPIRQTITIYRLRGARR